MSVLSGIGQQPPIFSTGGGGNLINSPIPIFISEVSTLQYAGVPAGSGTFSSSIIFADPPPSGFEYGQDYLVQFTVFFNTDVATTLSLNSGQLVVDFGFNTGLQSASVGCTAVSTQTLENDSTFTGSSTQLCGVVTAPSPDNPTDVLVSVSIFLETTSLINPTWTASPSISSLSTGALITFTRI